ncbi:hypothetical protein GCM10011575_29240 [Microlunatus endophyticus]|uniref:DUF2269 family protein n=1 Tax=Microlunatus endophyticus TaxID=1716077 RepID=A0A917SAZ9_9ACTN|nr:DUF2269 family protein [Microlunatus endophyticus]GGL68767.1 hypothetical protein GCM10011575_29240 [Microlunatus endophyticus]
MFKVFLALHILAAVGAIGPLIHAATTAARGLRRSNATATAEASRVLRVYSIASIVVVILGFGLMSMTSPYTHRVVAKFTDTWIWLSLLLWLIGVGIAWGLLSRTLDRATTMINNEESIVALRGRVAAFGGIVALIFAAIIVLMVFQP